MKIPFPLTITIAGPTEPAPKAYVPGRTKLILSHTHEGWHIATSRGSKRCRTRQEAYAWLSSFMRREDEKAREEMRPRKTIARRKPRRKSKRRKK